MTTTWGHLPNAVHIDRILADISINSESLAAAWHAARGAVSDAAWHAAWDAAWSAALDSAYDAARHAAWDAARGAAWDATRDADLDEAWYATRDAILALIAWDESSEYLNLSRDQVQVLSLLGDKKAMLMLPAVCIFEQSTELV